MDLVAIFAQSTVAFLAVLTVVVFIHELGHYSVARWNGIRVEVFSIGFGPELFGRNDRHGTRWKLCLIPLGGYVKFFGDASESSEADPEAIARMSEAERAVSFHHKRVSQRAAVVAAGPVINFIFAAVVFAGMFAVIGQPFTPPVVGGVVPGSPAEKAGFAENDRVISVAGLSIQRFEEIRAAIVLRAEVETPVEVERQSGRLLLMVRPELVERADGMGGVQRIGQIGLRASAAMEFRKLPIHSAVWQGMRETFAVVDGTITYIGRIFSGRESGDQISGPIGIARISGEAAKISFGAVVGLIATLSVAIGFINLFPIPMLDGGHLLFYAFEALRGRPLGERAQEYGYRFGLTLVLSLFLFATWNDLNRLQVVSMIARLFS